MYTEVFDEEKVDDSAGEAAAELAAQKIAAAAYGSALGLLVSVGIAALTGLMVTNYHKQAVSGDKNVNPTTDETSLDSRQTVAVQQDSQLAHEEFNGQDSQIDGANTQANGAIADTNASSADVNASKTQAGAIDTGAQAMKIN